MLRSLLECSFSIRTNGARRWQDGAARVLPTNGYQAQRHSHDALTNPCRQLKRTNDSNKWIIEWRVTSARALGGSGDAARSSPGKSLGGVFESLACSDQIRHLLRGVEYRYTLRSCSPRPRELLKLSVGVPIGTLRSSKSRVYLLKDIDPVGQSASRSVGFSKWTVLIGRTGFDTISSIPDPTLSLTEETRVNTCGEVPVQIMRQALGENYPPVVSIIHLATSKGSTL